MLDEFSVWNKALGQGCIFRKSCINPPKPSDAIYNNLVAWFPFDEDKANSERYQSEQMAGKMNTGPGWKHILLSAFLKI
jgi:hypothetical protein